MPMGLKGLLLTQSRLPLRRSAWLTEVSQSGEVEIHVASYPGRDQGTATNYVLVTGLLGLYLLQKIEIGLVFQASMCWRGWMAQDPTSTQIHKFPSIDHESICPQ